LRGVNWMREACSAAFAGRRLLDEVDVGEPLYIILSGRLRAFSEEDGRQITYGSYGPGEYVGELSLDGGVRTASIETEEPTTCVVVTRRTLELFIAEQPSFAFELLAKVISRARSATMSARQMALNDVYGRLRIQFESLAISQPDGTRRIDERLTHKEIAQRIGCSPGMVTRQIKDLERGGYLRRDGATYVLLAPLPPRW